MIGPFVSPMFADRGLLFRGQKKNFFLHFPGEEVLDWLSAEFWKCQRIIKDRKVARAAARVLINPENHLARPNQLPNNEFILATIQNYCSRQNLSRKKI